MLKSVFKEIFIIILLCIAICLILGILFYEYIPMDTDIPKVEAYTTPNEVKAEIEDDIFNNEKPNLIEYEISDVELNVYKQSGSYTSGKVNPFALDETSSNTSDNNESNNNDNSDNNNNDNNNQNTNENNGQTNIDKNSTGTFFNEEGIK